jgi:magnesium-protoporphyrin IX monomethyl ester (oxidative) cyclase
VDIEHPSWQPNLERLQKANVDLAEAAEETGLGGMLKRNWARARAARAFVALYFIPAKKHTVPAVTRLEPAY